MISTEPFAELLITELHIISIRTFRVILSQLPIIRELSLQGIPMTRGVSALSYPTVAG